MEDEIRNRPLKQSFGADPNNPFAGMYETDVASAQSGIKKKFRIKTTEIWQT